jgi:very-short-patch-repair endonuclease
VHQLPEVAARDLEREAWLNARGYTVTRFLNAQAVADLDSVMQSILARVSLDAASEP